MGLAQQMVPSRYRSTYIELTLCHVIKITFVPILFVIQADLKRRVPGLVMMNRLFFFVDSFVNLGLICRFFRIQIFVDYHKVSPLGTW